MISLFLPLRLVGPRCCAGLLTGQWDLEVRRRLQTARPAGVPIRFHNK
jgi:hypothetical protein